MPGEATVLVLAEHELGTLRPITLELLGAARRIASDLGHSVTAVLFGPGSSQAAAEIFEFGADVAVALDSADLDTYRGDPWATALVAVAKRTNPSIVLVGQTEVGRDLAPRFATRVGTAVAMDCIGLSIENGRLLMTRPCFGGNAHARYSCNTIPAVATVRPKSQEPLTPDASRSGTVVNLDFEVSGNRTQVVGREQVTSTGPRLEEARAIVSGGRGLGSAEAFSELTTLANVLGGAVAASRAAVDLGWAPVSSQVGLTGKVVTPELYVAIGISGASQHIAGITGARTIVAVNKDPNADIFKYARYGVIADWKEFVPAFTQSCRRLLTTS